MNSFHALILKKRIFRDSDLVLTLLTDKLGEIEVVAKAALKTTSKKSSKIDILNYVYITIVEGKVYTILTEIKVIENFSEIKSGKNIYLSWWFAEVIEKLSSMMDSNSYDFENLISSIKLACQHNDKIVIILAHSILQLLLQSGVNINFSNFLESGFDIVEDSEKYLAFDSNNMGFSENVNLTLDVDNQLYKVLKFLSNNSTEEILKLDLTKELENKLIKVLTLWVENLCGNVIVSKKLI